MPTKSITVKETKCTKAGHANPQKLAGGKNGERVPPTKAVVPPSEYVKRGMHTEGQQLLKKRIWLHTKVKPGFHMTTFKNLNETET